MKIERFAIAGPVLIEPTVHRDDRGWFFEAFRQDAFDADIAPDTRFVQDNQSISHVAGTVRGLHFQIAPRAQGKLVRVLRGAILDVAVDLRSGSPTFGRHVAVELTHDDRRQFWIPAGFAHGFCTLQPDTEILYKATDFYSPAHDRGLLWNDPALAIDWPVPIAEAILSDRDKRLPRLADLSAPADQPRSDSTEDRR